MKNFLKILFVATLFSSTSCQSDDLVQGLNPNQEKAMMWTDWGAGLATAELGPVSFVIGAAASTAYYYDHLPPGQRTSSYVNENTDSSYTDEFQRLGVDHNSACKKYIFDGYTAFRFADFKNVSIDVRPDLYELINNLDQNYFETVYFNVTSVDWETPNSIVTFVERYVNLNETDRQRLLNKVTQIVREPDPNVEYLTINELIDEIDTYFITHTEKDNLVRSFSILKASSKLWKQ